MPIYGAVGNVQSLFPAISSVSALNSAMVCKYMDSVEAQINAKLAKRYAIPVSSGSIPPLLTAISERETIYRIVTQRGLITFPPAQQGAHPLQIQHKEDMALLDDIANGTISLVDSAGSDVAIGSSIQLYSTTQNYNPTFNEGLAMNEALPDTQKHDDAILDRVNRT